MSGCSSVRLSSVRSAARSGASSGAGANWPPEKDWETPSSAQPSSSRLAAISSRGVGAAPARSSHQVRRRRLRSTPQARSETARRSPLPMKRRARKNSFATASAGRGDASIGFKQVDGGGDAGGGGHVLRAPPPNLLTSALHRSFKEGQGAPPPGPRSACRRCLQRCAAGGSSADMSSVHVPDSEQTKLAVWGLRPQRVQGRALALAYSCR